MARLVLDEPLRRVASIASWSATYTKNPIDVTPFSGTPNRTYAVEYLDLKGDLAGYWDTAEATLMHALMFGDEVIELALDITPGERFWQGTAVLDVGVTTPSSDAVRLSARWWPARRPKLPAPTLTLQPGGGVTAGRHDYTVTVITPSGETPAGLRASILVGVVAPPATAPEVGLLTGIGLDLGDFTYAMSYVTLMGETTVGPFSPSIRTVWLPDGTQVCQVRVSLLRGPAPVPGGGALVITGRRLYRWTPTIPQFKRVANIVDNATTTWVDALPTGSEGPLAPTVNTAGGNQVAVTNIPVGGPTATARGLYRTAANGTTLQRVTVITDNTTTTYTDTLPDSGLGPPPPP